MFRSNAAALRADAERLRACARELHRPEDADSLRALAARCEATAAALEAQSRQVSISGGD
jgi:hypothetical protein